MQRSPVNRPPAATVRAARLRLARQLRRQDAENNSAEVSQTDACLRHAYALIDLLRLAVAERTEGKR